MAPIVGTTREQKTQIRHGSGLTPMALTRAIYNADQGFMRLISDVLDEVRETDSHLQGILQKRELRVASADLRIVPGKRRRATKKAKDIAAFCDDVLQNIIDFRPMLAHLMNGVYMSRAIAEMEWGQVGRFFVPLRWHFIHSRRVSYNDYFEPVILDEDGGQYRWPGQKISEFESGKIIFFAPRIRHTYPTREGIGRTVMWPAAFKKWGIRDWLSLAEMAGRPAKIGTYGTGKRSQEDTSFAGVNKLPEATKEHKDLLIKAIRSYSTSLDIALPDSVMLQHIFPPSNLDSVHTGLIEWCNAEMSKAVTGETLSTDAGNRGARSLGEVHIGEATMIARWDAMQLADTIRYQILSPLVKINFGPDAPVPYLMFNVDPKESLDAEATRIEKLTKSGLRIAAGEVREVFGYSEPSQDEEVIGGASKASGGALVEDGTQPTDQTQKRQTLPSGDPQDDSSAQP